MIEQKQKSISTRLMEERKRLGLSQEDMAALGGYKIGAYHKYETAKKLPELGYLLAAQDKGLDLLYVIHGRRSTSENNAELDALMQKIEELKEKERAAVTALIDALSG